MIRSDPMSLQTPKAMRQLVLDSEERFECQLRDLCDQVSSLRDLRTIMLSGPSCSGKTTTANKLIGSLVKSGRDVHVISVDDFYYDRMYLMARSEQLGKDVDFESIVSIDLPFFKMCMDSLLSGEKTLLPHYDFKLGRRSSYESYQMTENSVLLVEGIQAIYPEIVSVFDTQPKVSVFSCVESDIACGDVVFDCTEVRLIRRLVRDHHFRGANAEFTLSLWKSVTNNEKRSIFPNRHLVDYSINSAMAYEPYVMRDYLIPLLESGVPKNSPYYQTARSLMDRLASLPSCESKWIPKKSVYREFIG